MFRQSLDADSANAFFFLKPGGHGPGLQMRTNAAASTDNIPISPGTWFYPELWMRLTRTNNVFSAYMAGRELNWTWLGSQHIPMTDPILVGMAVTSRTNDLLQVSYFQKVRLAPLAGRLQLNRTTNNTLRLILNGVFGSTYGIEASSDLKNWARLTTQPNTNGVIIVHNNDPATYARRFYRAVLVE